MRLLWRRGLWSRRHAMESLFRSLKCNAVRFPILFWTQPGNFLVNVLDTIAGIRVIRKELNRPLRVSLLDDSEELRHGVGIISRLVKYVSADRISLRFRAARIAQQDRIHAEGQPKLRQLA